jgi:putative hydrolase of the HAD superfamily
LFDAVLERHGLLDELPAVVRVFQRCRFPLSPYPDVIATLRKLTEMGKILGIITDGNPERQEAKIAALGLDACFPTIILTGRLGAPKPSRKAFDAFAATTGLDPARVLYAGDNPLLDISGAKQAGMLSALIRRGEFAAVAPVDPPDFTLQNVGELLDIVA